MTFASLPFIFFFLPLSVLVCLLLPERFRLYGMAVLSVIFYAWGKPSHMILILLLSLFNYASGRIIDEMLWNGRTGFGRFFLIFAVAVNLGTLGVFKYTSLDFPVGLSFYTFSALSYLFDVYRDQQEVERNPVYMLLYISFFPKVTSGPIVSYRQWKDELNIHSMSREDILVGSRLLFKGLLKKLLLADRLGGAFQAVQSIGRFGAGSAWLGMLLYSLQLYYDFSGYSDMAIGIARMFGFRFDKNFDHPYVSKSMTDFWRRWHISLGAWFRDYVYIPLGGNRRGKIRQALNLALVWILTGIWHGSTLNFLAWGVWHGCFILLEKFVLGKKIERLPSLARILITDAIAMLGWVWFFSSDLSGALHWFGCMFGIGAAGAGGTETIFILKENVLLILAGLLFSVPFPGYVFRHYAYRSGKDGLVVSIVINIALFALSVAAMIGSTYQTFLYAKF